MGYGLSQSFLRFQLKASKYRKLISSKINTTSPTESTSINQKLNSKVDLPEDVIFHEILPKLPAKLLVRFKSVSPSWNTFISSVEFFKMLSNLSSKAVVTLDEDISFFEALDYNNESNLGTIYIGKQFHRYDTLCSSCNGLVFLISAYVSSSQLLQFPDELHRFEFNYVVYNPVLGVDHYIEIPHPFWIHLSIDHFHYLRTYNFGFGYVSSLNDYFIVVIDLRFRFDMNVNVHMYSLRTQQWRLITETIDVGDETLLLQFQDPWLFHTGTLVKETLYWGMKQGRDIQFIFAFDLETQNFHDLIDLPYGNFGNAGVHEYLSDFSLCCLDGSLCAWAHYQPDQFFEMWMFEEDEESESGYTWIWLFCVSPGCIVRNFFGCNMSGLILLFTGDGELILGDFTCHPPELSNVVLEEKCDVVDYVGSLVSVPNIATVPRQE